MFYSGNDNYMQDLYFYNQNPNAYSNTYNNMQGNNMNQNGFYMNNMYQNNVNPNNLYPSLYRILMPVICRVLQNSNFQYLNEDILNNMTDTVFNIIEGQIDYDNNSIKSGDNLSSVTSETNNNSSGAGSTNSKVSDTTRQNREQNSRNKSNSNDLLLKDIIRILILREIISRNQFQMQYMNGNQFYNGIGNNY